MSGFKRKKKLMWENMKKGKNNLDSLIRKINPDRFKNQLRNLRQFFSHSSSNRNELLRSKLNNFTESLVSLSNRSQFNLNITSNKENLSSGGSGDLENNIADSIEFLTESSSVVSDQEIVARETNSIPTIDSKRTCHLPDLITESKISNSIEELQEVNKIEYKELVDLFISEIINKSLKTVNELISNEYKKTANDVVEEIISKSLRHIQEKFSAEFKEETNKISETCESENKICENDSSVENVKKLVEDIILLSCEHVQNHHLNDCKNVASLLVKEIITKSEDFVNKCVEEKLLNKIKDVSNSPELSSDFKLKCLSTTINIEGIKTILKNDVEELLNERKMAGKSADVCIPSVFVESDYDVTDNFPVENKRICSSDLTLPLSLTPETSPRNKSPVTVQEWVDALPLLPTESSRDDDATDTSLFQPNNASENLISADNLNLGAEAQSLCGLFPNRISNEGVEVDEVGSHCSSGVDSLLEARKVDPEEVLLSLGFGRAPQYADPGRIPQRFLQPSKLKGVAIDDFLRYQQDLVHTFESGFCGYRGLTGPSHAAPSVIVAKIMERLREREREADVSLRRHSSTSSDKSVLAEKQGGRFNKAARNILTKVKCTPGSVLTPDNRRWLDSQGDKSPDVPRRIIIGQRSFTFSRDGDLIESPPSSITDSDSRWTSSTEALKPTTDSDHSRFLFPSIAEDQKSHDGTSAEPISSPNSKNFLNDELDSGIVEGFNSPSKNLTVQSSIDSFIDNSSSEEKDNLAFDRKNESNELLKNNLNTERNSHACEDLKTSIIDSDTHNYSFDHESRTESYFDTSGVNTTESEKDAYNQSESSDSSSLHYTHHSNLNKIKMSSNDLKFNNDSNRNIQVKSILSETLDNVLNNNPNLIYEHKLFDEASQPSFSNSESCQESASIFKEQKTDEKSTEVSADSSSEEVSKLIPVSASASVESSYRESRELSHSPEETLLSPSKASYSTLKDSYSPERELEELLSSIQPFGDVESHKESSDFDSGAMFENTISLPRKLSSICVSLDHMIELLERMDPLEQTSDFVVESDITLPGNLRKNKTIEQQYDELCVLGSQLQNIGINFEILSYEEFKKLDVNQRSALQCSTVRQALNSYLMKLNADEGNDELKSNIQPEVQKVSDLLDTIEDNQKLAAVVKQMTVLLRHHTQLSEQLRDLTASGKPLCIKLCDRIFRHVRALELLVQNNAKELAEVRQRLEASSAVSNKNK